MSGNSLRTLFLHNAMIGWRQDFHAHPELGFAEHRTAEKVAGLLHEFGLDVYRGLGGTGVVGVLRRGKSGRSVGLRADMDGLPITEVNSFDHCSRHEGAMHACGHDGHTAMLLGAARCLAESGDFDGRVVFIFQPNEEHGYGAAAMIDDGLFRRFDVDGVYGIHNIPDMPVGAFATRSGPITAAESLFEIEIKGRGGHAALPHMGVDAIMVGTEIVQSLQTIVARKLNPGLNGVVSVTEFIADGKRNVLAGNACLRGDARALTPEINEAIEAHMRQIAAGVCVAHGATATVSYKTIFPPVINAPDPVRAAVSAARALPAATRVDADCEPRLFSEDFAHMAAARPGCYLLMGNGTQGPHARPLHSADYDFNDETLTIGSSFWVQLVEQQLAYGAKS